MDHGMSEIRAVQATCNDFLIRTATSTQKRSLSPFYVVVSTFTFYPYWVVYVIGYYLFKWVDIALIRSILSICKEVLLYTLTRSDHLSGNAMIGSLAQGGISAPWRQVA